MEPVQFPTGCEAGTSDVPMGPKKEGCYIQFGACSYSMTTAILEFHFTFKAQPPLGLQGSIL